MKTALRRVCGVCVGIACIIVGMNKALAFEQDQRINGLALQFGTDTFATQNAFGLAFTAVVQSQLQSAIDSKIAAGSLSLLFEMPGLTDLTGTNEPSLQLGIVNGAPSLPIGNPTTYSGASDLDWWYTLNGGELDGNEVPTNQMPGAIAASLLTAGPGRLFFASSPVGDGSMAMSSALLKASIGSSSAPLVSTNGFPPGHLFSENLDPSLVSFASMSAGQLKGSISASSLAGMPVSPLMVSQLSDGYTTNNSMLDLLVSGGHALGGIIVVVHATQPDKADPDAPVLGAGPPYHFTVDAITKSVNGCTDKNGSPVNLANGLNAAAYSAYFKFTTDRVIAKHFPSIAVEQPAGTNLVDGAATVDYGIVFIGAPAGRTFTVTNSGAGALTGLAVTFDGTNAADFIVTAPPASTVIPHGSTTFAVGFAPVSPGIKSAALHIASNVAGTNNPFDIFLAGHALDPNGDDDGDGVSNQAELNLASLGFDLFVDNTSLITLLRTNGFYRASDVQTLALGSPLLIEKNATNGDFHLILGIAKSPDLLNWTPLIDFTPAYNPTNGQIDVVFPPDAFNAQFYRVFGSKP